MMSTPKLPHSTSADRSTKQVTPLPFAFPIAHSREVLESSAIHDRALLFDATDHFWA